MKRTLILMIVFGVLLLPGCSIVAGDGNNSVVKPKYHHRWYHRKKDKQVKRVRLVRMK